jgi:Arc/MetJ family transcription regulator
MRTNIEIDEDLIRQVMRLRGLNTKKEAVHAALTDSLRLARQREVLRSFGAYKIDDNLDETRSDKPDSPWF